MNILREKAQEGKLNAKDLFEGTVSISNIGIYLVK
jgi:pyruvate/2-oxoglutarate dehydrogenase complex dihydrolipoamide acyltransferase (E2) component